MDGISRAMNRGHRVVRAHPIDLSTPPTEEHQEEEKQGHCCCKDIHTHCKSVHHDGTVAGVFAVTRCLAQREKQFHDIKPDCAEKVMETVAGACLNDIEQFCPSVKPGNSNIHTCLYTHKDNLTPTCKKYMHVTTKQLPAVHHAPKAQAVPAKV